MRNNKKTLLIHCAYVFIDVACIFLAIYVVLLLCKGTLPFAVTWQGFFSSTNPFKVIFLMWIPIILFFNQTHGLYRTHREMLEGIEILEVVKSVCIATFVVIVLVYLLKVTDFPRSVMILSAGALMLLFSLWRVLKKLLVNYLVAQGYNNFNAVIVGAGKIGVLLADEIKKRPSLGIKVIGFLDDEKKTGLPILGKLNDFQDIIQRGFVHQVFITVHSDYSAFMKLLEIAKEKDIAVRVVPQGFEFMANDFIQYNIGIIPILEYSCINVNYRQRGKRLFDFFFSFLLILSLLPIFVGLALLIKLDSVGPVFYRSRRYGLHGKVFNMIKFRTMVANAQDMLDSLKDKNEVSGPIFKIKKDPRITKVGAFLRRYSLDELPQIINVMMADMSLVGPRPLPIEQIEKEDLRQLKRLDIRPGITGLWQIRGRSDVSFDRLLRWDIWYINNWSFSLDLYILFQTFPVVIKGKGAY